MGNDAQTGGTQFFRDTVKELMGWTDYALGAAGRLTEPMRYDAVSDKYVPVSWIKPLNSPGGTFAASTIRTKRLSTPRGG
jgi:hypothetical protein